MCLACPTLWWPLSTPLLKDSFFGRRAETSRRDPRTSEANFTGFDLLARRYNSSGGEPFNLRGGGCHGSVAALRTKSQALGADEGNVGDA